MRRLLLGVVVLIGCGGGAVDATDRLSGQWSFSLTPDIGSGLMTLALDGTSVSGDYGVLHMAPDDSAGSGLVSGAFDGKTLRLSFAGKLEATVVAKVEPMGEHLYIPQGTAMMGAQVVGFSGYWMSE